MNPLVSKRFMLHFYATSFPVAPQTCSWFELWDPFRRGTGAAAEHAAVSHNSLLLLLEGKTAAVIAFHQL